MAQTFLRPGLLEKIGLIALTGIIFGLMLNVQAEPIGIAVLVGIVVIGNAALSLVLERQGFGPGPALRQFVVTGLLNIVVVIVMFFVFDLLGYPIDGQNTGFFVFLITLLVTLYDRYRPFWTRYQRAQRLAYDLPIDVKGARIIIVGMGLITHAIRLSMILTSGRLSIGEPLRRAG